MPKDKTNPAFIWLRTIGGASGLVGGILIPGVFWVGALCVIASFVSFGIDPWFEPRLRGKTQWKIAITVSMLGAVLAFYCFMLRPNASPMIYGLVTDGEQSNRTIAGIEWRPEFTELKVSINNPTSASLEDLSITIRPDAPVAKIGQLSNVPGFSYELRQPLQGTLFDVDVASGKKLVLPLVLLATDTGYIVHCDKLPAGQTLEVVMALADVKWAPTPPRTDILHAVRDKDYVQRLVSLSDSNLADMSTYWLGYSDGNMYTLRPHTNWIMVKTAYISNYRPYSTTQKVEVGGNITFRPR